MMGGIWGVLAVGLFASENGMATAYTETDQYGLLLGGGVEQLGIQLLGIVAIVGWTAVTSSIMFAIIKATYGLRVGEAEEIRGLDLDEGGVEWVEQVGPPLQGRRDEQVHPHAARERRAVDRQGGLRHEHRRHGRRRPRRRGARGRRRRGRRR